MQIITEKVNDSLFPHINILDSIYPDKRIMMFDIETTGLSPDRSFIYLIGMNLKIDGEWNIVLLFNDDGKSEPEIIRYFQETLSRHDVLVEFNGDTFDINFVKRRMHIISTKLDITIPDHFDEVKPVDLMKLIRPYKFALGLPNIKQKTIERYLGVDREDKYNGGQLIDVYLSFLTDKSEYSKKLVLQHNRDDMEGMLYLLDIFAIEALSSGHFSIKNIGTTTDAGILKFILELQLDNKLPRRIFSSSNGISFDGDGTTALIKAPITSGTLNYYYPGAGKAFEEKEGYFVPALNAILTTIPQYKKEYKDKLTYIEMCDSFLGSEECLISYASEMCRLILKNLCKK